MQSKIIAFLVVALFLTALGCESPLGPAELSWRVAVYFPYSVDAEDICTAEEGIYAAAGPSLYIFYESTGELDEVYTSDDAYFYAVDAYGNNIWLGGYRNVEGGGEIPVVAYRAGGEWFEADLPAGGLGFNSVHSITAVPGQEPACYVFLFNGSDYTTGIALYEPVSDEISLVSELDGFHPPVRTEGGRIFSVKYDGPDWHYFYVAIKDPESTDFVFEKVPVSWGRFTVFAPIGPPEFGVETVCTAAEGLAIIGGLTWEGGPDVGDYTGVVLRDDAPPGEGTYSLSFYSPWASDFQAIYTCAFRDEDNGCVLGQETSTFLVNGKWIKEGPTGYAEHFEDAAVKNGKYYALIYYYRKQALCYSER